MNEKQQKKAEKLARLIAEGSRAGCRAIQKVDSATRERILEESMTTSHLTPHDSVTCF
jgi:uncharacterized protein YoaH (UPF0181 family)